ncbi:MAG: heparinase II/III family protein, partial [Gemmatimonadaceae bacterium]|nr:heparinase II/III family protein [Gemmatimonadaceae bacterium]
SVENPLDHSHLVDGINAILGRPSPKTLEREVLLAYARQAIEAPTTLPATDIPSRQPSRATAPDDTVATSFEIPVESLQLLSFRDFGVFVFRGSRIFIGIRCGPVGQNGIGGHAHNDQLSVELQVDCHDLIADPGTFVYTPFPQIRNRYRSAAAHFAPYPAGEEQGNLSGGLFRLDDPWAAACLEFQGGRFVGEIARRKKIIRTTVTIADGLLSIVDESWGCTLARRGSVEPPHFSAGYGEQVRSGVKD